MGRLAVSLTNVLGRIIEDKTGLTGTYDFTLDWEIDPGAPDANRRVDVCSALEGAALASDSMPTKGRLRC